MPSLRDVLDRFRRAGTPGPAARAGVPADRSRDISAELDPVLAQLDATQDECRRLRDTATHEAAQIRLQAQQRAALLVADASSRAEAVRAQAASTEYGRGIAEIDRIAADAAAEAERIRVGAEQEMPEYVARIVDLFLELVQEEALAANVPSSVRPHSRL